MQERHVAGLSLGIARRGVSLYLRGYGLSDVERRRSADGFTVYRAGSIAKQFTAALVMAESERGRIALTRSAAAYVSPGANLPDGITVAELLSQTSGIAAASETANVAIQADPGTAWSYSNANYALLGDALERVTGMPFATLLATRITTPLGLAATGCTWPPPGADVARGYAWDGGWQPAPPSQPWAAAGYACAAGGLNSNVPDLLRWLDALRGGRIVSPASFATMTHSVRVDGVPANYGYGFFIARWYGYGVAEHPGYVDGFSALDAIVLDDGLEIAVLANAATVDLSPLAQSIVAAIDPPKDSALVAAPNAAPQNENPRITAALSALLRTPGFATYGTPLALEFVERKNAAGTTHDTYRVTFSTGQWWADVGYRPDGAIVSLSLALIA